MARLLITAGPTHEYLDDVRYLANASSGRMGYAIAEAAARAGHDVLLVSGPTALPTPPGVERVDVVSAREMHDRALAAFQDRDIAFGVAAVADFRPAARQRGKPAKAEVAPAIALVANPDVVAALGAAKGRRRVVVGFALEVFDQDDLPAAVARARGKLTRKRLDLCVLNHAETMGAQDALLTVLDGEAVLENIGPDTKAAVAERLVTLAVDVWQRKNDDIEEAPD